MKDTFLKLKILCSYMCATYEQWKERIWDHDLDERVCCDGRECGCMGSTIREEELHYLNKP